MKLSPTGVLGSGISDWRCPYDDDQPIDFLRFWIWELILAFSDDSISGMTLFAFVDTIRSGVTNKDLPVLVKFKCSGKSAECWGTVELLNPFLDRTLGEATMLLPYTPGVSLTIHTSWSSGDRATGGDCMHLHEKIIFQCKTAKDSDQYIKWNKF